MYDLILVGLDKKYKSNGKIRNEWQTHISLQPVAGGWRGQWFSIVVQSFLLGASHVDGLVHIIQLVHHTPMTSVSIFCQRWRSVAATLVSRGRQACANDTVTSLQRLATITVKFYS